MDNYAAFKRIEIRDWLAANPRIHVHFTPTSGSWLNLVEVWLGVLADVPAVDEAPDLGHKFTHGDEGAAADGLALNDPAFIWTKTPEEILTNIDRKRKMTSPPSH